MNWDETKTLIAKAALVDNRTASSAIVTAWQEVLENVDFEEAMAALTLHRRESDEYLQPSHIIQNVRKIRDLKRREAARQKQLTAKQDERDAAKPFAYAFGRGLPAEMQQRFQDEFNAGRVKGNGDRAYNRAIHLGATHAEATTIRAEAETKTRQAIEAGK